MEGKGELLRTYKTVRGGEKKNLEKALRKGGTLLSDMREGRDGRQTGNRTEEKKDTSFASGGTEKTKKGFARHLFDSYGWGGMVAVNRRGNLRVGNACDRAINLIARGSVRGNGPRKKNEKRGESKTLFVGGGGVWGRESAEGASRVGGGCPGSLGTL